jgi:hypothetical protein
MKQGTSRREEVMARAAIGLTALMFLLGAAVVLAAGHSLWVVTGLVVVGAALAWLALGAGSRLAQAVGRWFPLG